MSRAATPTRPRSASPTGSDREGEGRPERVKRFPPVASPIRVARQVEGCIHCCGKCETHPCRLKGQV